MFSFIRNIQFFGLEHQKKVISSYIVVIGLGGVGSHAASMLLRSGVGKLLLVDFDQVSVSSLNRHAVATREDVGTPKALCLKKHFSTIFPECHIDAKVLLYDSSSEEEILSGNPDFVLDCIDNIDTKVFLKGPSLYAFKGLAGRLAPIGVHLALLLIMAGGTLSAAGSFRGSVTVPQGLNFVIGDVLGPSGFLSTPSESFNTEVHVNRFSMDYYSSGEVGNYTVNTESADNSSPD